MAYFFSEQLSAASTLEHSAHRSYLGCFRHIQRDSGNSLWKDKTEWATRVTSLLTEVHTSIFHLSKAQHSSVGSGDQREVHLLQHTPPMQNDCIPPFSSRLTDRGIIPHSYNPNL